MKVRRSDENRSRAAGARRLRRGSSTAAVALSAALLALSSVPAAQAEHGYPWLIAFPSPGQELPPNGVLTLLAHNGPHPYVASPGGFRYRLASAAGNVPLRPGRRGRGIDWDGYGVSYLELRATRMLNPDETYRLDVLRRGEPDWNPAHVAMPFSGPTATYGGPSGGAHWRTRPRFDRLRPRWLADPNVTEGDYGPRIEARVEDGNAVSFHVRAVRRGAPLIDVITQHAPVFGVHDACDTVLLDLGHVYRVMLVPVDAAGNRGRMRSLRVDTAEGDNLLVCLR